MKRFFIFLVLFLISVFIFPKISQAVDLIVDEAKIRLNINPGEMKRGTINIKNTSAEPISIKAYLQDWYYLPEADGSKEFLPAGTAELSCAPWITFNPAEFVIPAFGKQVVNYTANVPVTATGGHYAVLFFETSLADAKPQEGVGFSVAVRIGSLFYVEAEGTVKREVEVKDFSLQKAGKKSPLSMELTLENSGNVDITASGTYHIIDKKGMVYARGEFSDIYTLPEDSGTMRAGWEEAIPAGEYDLILTLDLGKALREAGMNASGLTVVKEAEIKIGYSGEVVSVSKVR